MSEDNNPDTGPEITPGTGPETNLDSVPVADTEVGAETAAGSDLPPDRLAINPRSPFYDVDKLQRGIGIRFKGAVRTNVEEYSISEGWIRVQAGKTMDRKRQPLTLKLSGTVEAWYEDLGESAPVAKKD